MPMRGAKRTDVPIGGNNSAQFAHVIVQAPTCVCRDRQGRG